MAILCTDQPGSKRWAGTGPHEGLRLDGYAEVGLSTMYGVAQSMRPGAIAQYSLTCSGVRPAASCSRTTARISFASPAGESWIERPWQTTQRSWDATSRVCTSSRDSVAGGSEVGVFSEEAVARMNSLGSDALGGAHVLLRV